MSVDISVSITENKVDIIATPTVNIVNVTNSASIDPGLYDLSEFTNTSPNPFVRTSGLSSYVPTSRTISTTSPLSGGGDLSVNRTLSISQANGSTNGFLSSSDWTMFNNKQNALGFTPVPTTRTLTINGTTQDLSANRTFTIASGVTDVTATAPIESTGGATPDISIRQSGSLDDGYLSSADWIAFNNKQDALTLTTTGTSGAATLVGSTLNIPQYSGGGGASGIHALVKPISGTAVCQQLVASGIGSTAQNPNRLIVAPFIPANSFTCSNLFIRVITAVASSLAKIIVYDNLNGIPNNLIYASADLDCSTTGTKTASTTYNFVAGTTYWIGVFTSNNQAIFTMAANQTYSFIVTGAVPNTSNCLTTTVTYGAAPDPAPTLGPTLTTMPFVGITAA